MKGTDITVFTNMNILFYYGQTYSSLFGGISNVSKFLGETFKARGHNVVYLSTFKTGETQVEPQLYLPNPRDVFSIENRLYFERIIYENDIDIVINQNGTTPQSNEAVLWSQELCTTVISVVHTSLYGIYREVCTLRRFGMPKAIRYRISAMYYSHKYKPLYKRMVDLSDAIVTLSDKFFVELIEYGGVGAKEKLHTIPNPCTLSGCDVMPRKQKNIVYVGRLSREKNVPLLIRIWSKLEKRNPEWTLTIVGDGREMEKCLRTVDKYNLHNVMFTGRKADPSLYYERASIFCMTSSFEGFGLVLVEAMANYTIPIAFNSYANVGDIIGDGVSGFLVDPFDENQYAERLQYLIDNEDICKTMAEAAKKQSMKFLPETVAEKWEKLFRELKNRK